MNNAAHLIYSKHHNNHQNNVDGGTHRANDPLQDLWQVQKQCQTGDLM